MSYFSQRAQHDMTVIRDVQVTDTSVEDRDTQPSLNWTTREKGTKQYREKKWKTKKRSEIRKKYKKNKKRENKNHDAER